MCECKIPDVEGRRRGVAHADDANTGAHPVVTMFEASQPILTGIAQNPSLQASIPVVSAVCEVGV